MIAHDRHRLGCSYRLWCEEVPMELTLRYRGPLEAEGADKRVREKHGLRLHFARQLRDFWTRDLRLKDFDLSALQTVARVGQTFPVARPIAGQMGFYYQFPLNGFAFIPLVTGARESDCELTIRIHRPQNSGSIVFTGGDLDNRLKVLFDALRMPHNLEQLGGSTPAADTDGRVFCLLEDDNLITKFTIESKRLLDPPPGDLNYVELDIDVRLTAISPIVANLPMLFP